MEFSYFYGQLTLSIHGHLDIFACAGLESPLALKLFLFREYILFGIQIILLS